MTRQDWIDQGMHIGAGAIIVVLANWGLFGGLLAGIGCGLIRELSEAGGARITWPEVVAHFSKGRDPYIDVAFWSLGGAIAGILVG